MAFWPELDSKFSSTNTSNSYIIYFESSFRSNICVAGENRERNFSEMPGGADG